MTKWLCVFGNGRPSAFSADGGASWFTQNGKPWALRGGNGWLFGYQGATALAGSPT